MKLVLDKTDKNNYRVALAIPFTDAETGEETVEKIYGKTINFFLKGRSSIKNITVNSLLSTEDISMMEQNLQYLKAICHADYLAKTAGFGSIVEETISKNAYQIEKSKSEKGNAVLLVTISADGVEPVKLFDLHGLAIIRFVFGSESEEFKKAQNIKYECDTEFFKKETEKVIVADKNGE